MCTYKSQICADTAEIVRVCVQRTSCMCDDGVGPRDTSIAYPCIIIAAIGCAAPAPH